MTSTAASAATLPRLSPEDTIKLCAMVLDEIKVRLDAGDKPTLKLMETALQKMQGMYGDGK